MKTNTLKFSVLSDNADQSGAQNIKSTRKPLKALQSNVTKHVGTQPLKKPVLKDNPKTAKSQDDKQKKDLINEVTQTASTVPVVVDKEIQLSLKKITVEDLTTAENPSESYWQVLAETRRTALENALEENRKLRQRLELLEKKCRLKDDMLEEARAMAEVLQELLQDN